MNATSSHKSWRPLTILTFRYFAASSPSSSEWWWNQGIIRQRVWNVITHAAIAESVSLLAIRLVQPNQNSRGPTNVPLLLRTLVKLVFGLHPTHVEVTANAANRPHLLAVLWAVWLCDDTVPWITLFPLLLLLCGYLSSETFLFATIPIAVTRTILLWGPPQSRTTRNASLSTTSPRSIARWQTLRHTIGIWFVVGTSGILYYIGRYTLDWLSIPDGLIRPAENPFFHLQGLDRLRSYAYVTVLHVLKAWDWDIIGFSHEYGVACILPVTEWNDVRLLWTAAVLAAYVVLTLEWTRRVYVQWRKTAPPQSHSHRHHYYPTGWVLWIVHLSWMVTLFPISGIVKVGTFVADRIVVPASVGTTFLTAYAWTMWLTHGGRRRWFWNPSRWSIREGMLLLYLALSWQRIHQRTTEWMGPVSLLESSLQTCPRSAKSHLEYSKTLSGLFPARLNLSRARWHLEQVEDIDPLYCDVHQQFAHVAVQEHKYLEFEDRLTKAVVCPFTMGGAMETWKRYWAMTLDPSQNAPAAVAAARKRQDKYMEVINAAIEAEAAQDKEEEARSASPLVWKR